VISINIRDDIYNDAREPEVVVEPEPNISAEPEVVVESEPAVVVEPELGDDKVTGNVVEHSNVGGIHWATIGYSVGGIVLLAGILFFILAVGKRRKKDGDGEIVVKKLSEQKL